MPAREGEPPRVKTHTARGRRFGQPLERDVVHGHDQRASADRWYRETRRVHDVGLDANPGPAEAVPHLVARAAVGSAEVDPRNAVRHTAGPFSGRERDRLDAEVGKLAQERDLVAADATRHRLQQLTCVHGDLHGRCSLMRR